MAKVANVYSRKIYVTDDNPRNEDPKKIRNQIIKGIEQSKCFNIGNRSKAIEKALLNARPNEVVLIAGKGHETYQEINGVKSEFDDFDIVKGILNQKN